MDLAEAESAAISAGPRVARSGVALASLGKPRDIVTEWEERVQSQFEALKKFAASCGCSLKQKHLPPPLLSIKPGREITAYHDPILDRVWKVTFPGEAGFGQFGYYTPAGYLRRLRLSNIIFGDSVEFEGVISCKNGLSLVTSQSYIQAHPTRFIPTQEEIAGYLKGLGFTHNDALMLWERVDGVQLADTHDRNFIRAPDECIIAIDVQPRLLPGHDFEAVRPT